ncbi:MAG: hypothetical protein OEY59_13515 [Deltaproteobacteria bacterium]|nr:hypothetical protein [Deltaproteobacteria bacterium]
MKKGDNKKPDTTIDKARKMLSKKSVTLEIGGIDFRFSAASKTIFKLAIELEETMRDDDKFYVFVTNTLLDLIDEEQELGFSELINDPENPTLRLQIFTTVFPKLSGNKVKLGKLKSELKT